MGIINLKTGEEKKLAAKEIEQAAKEMRAYTLTALCAAGSGHSGGSLSCMDIMAVLYLHELRHDPRSPFWEDRDRFILSGGHKAPALYVAMGRSGYFDIKQIMTLRKLESPFQGHPHWLKLAGIEASTGSLGQGLSIAIGLAIAAKLDKKQHRIFCLMGDGEQQEGQVWEAAMEAAHHNLDNLVAIVDSNKLQIDGKVADVMNVESLAAKYKAFNWNVVKIDGHNVKQIIEAFNEARKTKDKPTVIIAETTKGKSVSFMENAPEWHGRAPNREQLDKALAELKVELPVDDLLKIAQDYQAKKDGEVSATVPKFSKDYWWNSQKKMKAEMKPTRKGFGEILAEQGDDKRLVCLGADISSSICMDMFYTGHPDRNCRFFNMGIAEQSGTGVAAGLAKEGKIPIFGTYGVFAAGRALDQLRTTVCYGNFNVKIAGAHGGISVGPDGATHQALEEFYQMCGLPNMHVSAPCDAIETRKLVDANLFEVKGPCYMRFAREATPIVTKPNTPYKFGVANIIKYKEEYENFADAFDAKLSTDFKPIKTEKEHITIVACGPEVAEAMRAAWILKQEFKIETRVINMHTLKPFDRRAVVDAAKETGAVLTVEEHQAGGLGNLVAAAIAEAGVPLKKFAMIGIQDRFGESGQPWELMKYFGLTAEFIAKKAKEMVGK